MKITFIANEMPYPPNHGGRVDIWRRIKGMHKAGVRLQFIAWQGSNPEHRAKREDIEELGKYVDEVHLINIDRSWLGRALRLPYLLHYPSLAATMTIASRQKRDLSDLVRLYSPSAVWLESIYGAALAQKLTDKHKTPLYVRSHNIEHQYMRRLAVLATDVQERIALRLNMLHLESLERRLLKRARRFYDCSYDDLLWWQGQGYDNGIFLPQTIVPEEDFFPSQNPLFQPGEFDVIFMGNLHSPNNVEGLLWFLEQVLPIVVAARPEARILIAGSRPKDEIRAACTHHRQITLMPNPANSTDIYLAGKVLVNPILSGSGVMVKSIEMLFFDGFLVGTRQSIYGIPPAAKACFAVTDDAAQFAGYILDFLSGKTSQDIAARRQARADYGLAPLLAALDVIREELQEDGRKPQ